MGVDHTPVAGFTVTIPKDKLNATFEREEVDDLSDLCSKDDVDLDYATIGSSLSGDTEDILILEPTPSRVDKQIKDWLSMVNTVFQTELTIDDVRFTKDLYVW